ncbi:hypothetical protein INR49_021681, partial [Caranx melampygus]
MSAVVFSGIHSSIITVREVSVQTGWSISIPCLYDPHHRNNVKYLWKGPYSALSKTVVGTDQPRSVSEKFSIYDDTDQSIFTVSITDLTSQEEAYYWCAVMIGEFRKKYDREYFHLSVTTGVSSLYVDQQKLTAFEGGSVTVVCHHKYPKETKWCRVGRNCVTDQNRLIDGTPVTINTSIPNVFIVTMSELRTESSGWYWCTNGRLQVPVHITVYRLTSTPTTSTIPSTTNSAETHSATYKHSSLFMGTEPQTAHPTTPPGRESQQNEPKCLIRVTTIITTLVLQLLVVPAAFLGWRMIRHKKNRPEKPDIIVASQTGSDPELLYATVHYQRVAPWKAAKQCEI